MEEDSILFLALAAARASASALPAEMVVRAVKGSCYQKGFRVRQLTVITTLLDLGTLSCAGDPSCLFATLENGNVLGRFKDDSANGVFTRPHSYDGLP